MFVEDGNETLWQFFKDGKEVQIAVDDEGYARMINAGYTPGKAIRSITRLAEDALGPEGAR